MTDRSLGGPISPQDFPIPRFDHPDPDYIAPEPLSFLSMVAGTMQVWKLPPTDRWLALAIGQADPEFPLQLIAAVGEATALGCNNDSHGR
ncbi:hypothetical protein [Kitasatospora sp. NPDC047058]|uniref:hypothetical protein n=1 Tax=Kitasatospora sp. NPDC047058 TaxID=3155620 RepID=UPI0034095E59